MMGILKDMHEQRMFDSDWEYRELRRTLALRLSDWAFGRLLITPFKTRLNYPWRRERREAQKLLNRSEKKLQPKNAPQGCLKDQRGQAVKVGCRCGIFE